MLKLTVIIPTRNRPRSLRRVIQSLLFQTLSQDDFEVIVVDNGPSSETAEVVNGFVGRMRNLRYEEEPNPGLHNARHAGMYAAGCDFLVYADDDILATPSWLSSIFKGFYQSGAKIIGGKNLPLWEETPPSWLLKRWERSTCDRHLGELSIIDFGDDAKYIDPCWVWGCNFSIHKSALLQAGGFHPDSMPNELLRFRGDGESHVSRFLAKRGDKALYHPGACVWHRVPRERMTLEYFIQRSFRQGVSDSYSDLRSRQGLVADSDLQSRFASFFNFHKRLSKFPFLPPSLKVRWCQSLAYREGEDWHRRLYCQDTEVRDWVLRPDYLECE